MYQSSISMHLLKSSICINYFELYMHKFFKHIEFKQIPWSLICINDLVNWFKYNVKCISGIVHEFISSNSFFLFQAVCENLSIAQVWCVLMYSLHVNKSLSHLFQMMLLIFLTLYQTRLMWAHTAKIFQDSMQRSVFASNHYSNLSNTS